MSSVRKIESKETGEGLLPEIKGLGTRRVTSVCSFLQAGKFKAQEEPLCHCKSEERIELMF